MTLDQIHKFSEYGKALGEALFPWMLVVIMCFMIFAVVIMVGTGCYMMFKQAKNGDTDL